MTIVIMKNIYFTIIIILILIWYFILECDLWLYCFYLPLNKQYDLIYNNSNNICILLTMTININKNINFLKLTNSNKRKSIYLNSIIRWLNETNFKIVIIENSGYDFKELENYKKEFSDRFEIISFNQSELLEANYLIGNNSKGAHEFFSINYAYLNSKLIPKSKFIIKITGRYFIKDLENFLNSINIDNYKAIRQYQFYRCELVGSHINNFNYIFNKDIKINNDIVEYEWSDRINKLNKDSVIICPLFKIDPTISGGDAKIINFI